MSWVFGVVAVSLGLYFLWGLVSPRGQWRALAAWSVANPHANEPSGASYGWRRLLSGVGVVGLVVVGVVASTPQLLAALPQETPVVPPIQEMWGSPSPLLVNRSVYGSDTAPQGLVEVSVAGYQDLDELDVVPPYLLELTPFLLLGDAAPPGYIGVTPDEGFSGPGLADLLVNVRASVLCIPRQAVVVETETTVQIAIYYGLPDPDAALSAERCRADDPISTSVLIPITLGSEIGDRDVVTFDGSEIRKVELVETL